MAINVGDKIYASTLNSLNNATVTIPANTQRYIYSYSGLVGGGSFGAGRYYAVWISGLSQVAIMRYESGTWVQKKTYTSTSGIVTANGPQPTSTAGGKLRRLIRSDVWRDTDGDPYYSTGVVISAAQVNANQIIAYA